MQYFALMKSDTVAMLSTEGYHIAFVFSVSLHSECFFFFFFVFYRVRRMVLMLQYTSFPWSISL
jgi:hypothetical protein